MPGVSWPSDKIEHWRLERLLPYAANPRTHDEAQVAQLAASMREFGWTVPVLADESGELIAGHGRVMAARSLGLDHAPVLVARGWSEDQKRAYRIADNQLAINSGWDIGVLNGELSALKLAGFDMPLLGFSDAELKEYLAPPLPDSDPDAVVEPQAEVVTRPGDIWVLGDHRLMCGDATKRAEVGLLLGGEKPHLMVTHPPYGVDYDPDWRNRTDRANGKPYGAMAVGRPLNDDLADWSAAWALFSGNVVYQWHPPGATQLAHWKALADCGFEIRMQIVWAKQQFPIGRGDYHVQHEPCAYAVRKGATAHWQGDRTQSTLWQIDKPVKSETGHSTQKPVECMKRPMENNSARGDA